MRYPDDHKARTRTRILDAAATVFRRLGYHASPVDAIMREAGLTPGGFYAHFASKEALFAEVLAHLGRKAELLPGKKHAHLSGAERLKAVAEIYLGAGHRENAESGCPMPPLVSEIPRAGAKAREAFEAGVRGVIAAQAEAVPDETALLALMALMVGGVSLSRAVADEGLAEKMLTACRTAAGVILDHAKGENS